MLRPGPGPKRGHEARQMKIKLRTEGGFCNRLRAIVSAALWAEDLGGELEIYWPVEPGHMPCRLEELLIPSSIPGLRSVTADYLNGAKQVLTDSYMHVVVSAAAYDHLSEIRIESYAEFHVDAASARGIAMLRQIRICGELEARADQLWKEIGGGSLWVGSHFRATDHAKCLARYPVSQLIDDMTNAAVTGGHKVFLVTDDLEVKADMIDQFGAVTVNIPVGRSSPEQQKCGVIEWLLLQKCGTIMGCRLSSYAVMAARRSGSKTLF